jgi:hypothetical protein
MSQLSPPPRPPLPPPPLPASRQQPSLSTAEQTIGATIFNRYSKKSGNATASAAADASSSILSDKMQNVARDLLRRKATETRFLLAQQSPNFATSLHAGKRSRYGSEGSNSFKRLSIVSSSSDPSEPIDHFDSVESLDDKFNLKEFFFTFFIEALPLGLSCVPVLLKYGPTQEFINVCGHRQLLPIKRYAGGASKGAVQFALTQVITFIFNWSQYFWMFLFFRYPDIMAAEGISVPQVLAVSVQSFLRVFVIAAKYSFFSPNDLKLMEGDETCWTPTITGKKMLLAGW